MQNSELHRAWSGVMDARRNPLRNYPLSTAHMLMQILAWMWSAVFSVSIGSYVVFGITATAHVLLIGALFITLIMFQRAELRAGISSEKIM